MIPVPTEVQSPGEMILPAAVFGLLVVAVTLYKFVFAVSEYDNLRLPLAGEPDGAKRFSLKSRLRYYYDCAALYTDAYYRCAKRLAGLPASQPVDYSLGHSRYWGDPWQFALVKTRLNSMMQSLIPAVDDELHYIVPLVLGTDTNSWKEVHLGDAVRMIVAGSSSRFTVGLPLCRNEDYLKRTLSITDGVMITATVGNRLSSIVLPVAARLASLHTWRNLNKIKDYITPQYHERLVALEKDSGDQPQDQLQVMLRFAQKKRPQEVNDLGIMATRLAASNFVSMHQTAGTAVQMLLNIIDSDPEFDTIAKLRAEADRELGLDGAWSREKFQRMHGHDSVARESMRVTFPFGNRGLLRKVMKDGVVTDAGIPLKKGTIRDPAKFDQPEKFYPWRFSRPIERERRANGDSLKAAYHQNSFMSTSPDYLPFGHGRHACPGRFLVDFELKMIVAYILKHYDIEYPPEYKGKRPPNRQVAELQAPPAGVKIIVRRRPQ
ncbi:ent-kaurene oxidase [Aspergillus udagawae]|uniref:Ent-kaurene oxidase n=1 Tax=Aspergillus udagawae TaxID=91492 RepID=A0A8H3XPW4_9EURO|nr:ent-kaurene oxidase [Aspergillus udagawae]